jgi:uncharacterized protein (DUF4415 family)
MTDETDWKRVRALTDADIATSVESDADTFMPDADWMANAQLVRPRTKKIVTLRLDPEILEWFMRSGRGYQTRINAVLKAFVDAQPH